MILMPATNLFLFLSMAFIFTFVVGKMLEKVRVPWIIASLFFGFILATYNPFSDVTASDTFEFLAELGMYFLLFVIGLDIDLKEIAKKSRFIFKATFFIIFLEAALGMLVVYYIFNCNLITAFLIALSFATVGEAVLVPILDEFRMIKSDLGQAILGIGLLDDIIEVFVLVLAASLIGAAANAHVNTMLIIGSLSLLFTITVLFRYLGEEGVRFHFTSIQTLFLFILSVLFFFLGIGAHAWSSALAAFLAGIGVKTFIPPKRLRALESDIRTMCYGFFAPLFFIWAGSSVRIPYLFSYPLLVLLIVLVSASGKLLGSYIVGKKLLGTKQAILLGIGLSVRFSTSIIIMRILYDSGIIGADVYSVIVASSAVFIFAIPLIFAYLLSKWGKVLRLHRKHTKALT